VFLRGTIHLSHDLAWRVVYFSSQNNNVHFNVFTFARECFVFRSEFALYDNCILWLKSQAKLKKFARRLSFTVAVVASFSGTSAKVSPWFGYWEVRKVNKRRFLDVQNVSLPLFYIEITAAKTGFKWTEWMQFTAHVISRRSTVNSLITEKISNNFISGRRILVDRGKILFLIHSVVLGSRNDLI